MAENEHRGRVTVYPADMRKAPLLDSAEPQSIMIRDEFGDPMLFLTRSLSDDTWGLSSRGDEDFMEVLVKYGFARLRPGVTARDVISKGAAACAEVIG